MRPINIIYLILSISIVSSIVKADDAKRSPEMQVLDHFVGTWDMSVTITPSGQSSVAVEGVSYRSWSKGGKYLLFEDPGLGEEMHMPLTYDTNAKEYRGVMISGDNTGVVSATWDDSTKTMSFLVEHTNQTTYRGSHRFVRPDYVEAFGKLSDAEGRVLVELSFRQELLKR